MTEAHRAHILYLEDDRALARLIGKFLEQANYEVDFAHDGAEGLAMFAANSYDLLALDFDLPVHDGLEIVRKLAPLEDLPPIIMVTACGDQSVAVEALKLGVADYVFKDAKGSYLRLLPLVIQQALDQRRLASERREAEKSLAESERLMHCVLDTNPNLIFAKDRHGRYLLANQAMAALYRVKPREMIGRTDSYFAEQGRITRDAVEQFRRNDDAVIDRQKTVRIPEERVEMLDGTIRWFQTVKSPLAVGAMSDCVLGVAVDITDRKQMEQDLAQAQKLEAVGQLAAGIAHEINTPIQYIGDNTRFLLEAFESFKDLLPLLERLIEACKAGSADDELLGEVEEAIRRSDVGYFAGEVPKAVQQSLEGVDRVARIVRAVKEFAHPGTDEKRAVDLNRAVENALTLGRSEWKYVAEMVTDFDPDLPPVYCLPSDINQVVLNLVVNAAQAIAEVVGDRPEEKGKITVSTRRNEPWAEIMVRDTGTGIPEKNRSKIFNPFFTTKEIGRGTGQGLSIAHSLVVEKHGGRIEFDTEIGRGTTFFVRLPIDGQPAVSDTSSTEIRQTAAY